jgi:nicotinamidase-related amidase
MANSTALLVIDVQVGFIENDPHVYQAQEKLAAISDLVQRARESGCAVVFVEQVSDPEIDGPIHPMVAPLDDERVVAKTTADAFHDTRLEEVLEGLGVKHLVVAGFQTEMCIDSTCRRAWSLGYEVTLVEDAHSTFEFENAPINAAHTIAHHNFVLGNFTTVKKSADVLFSVSPSLP